MNMKLKMYANVVLIICLALPVVVKAVCNCEDKKHADVKIVRCWYTQKDLRRINKKNADRHKQVGIAEGCCFYCGCTIEKHTVE